MVKSALWLMTFGPIISACLCMFTAIGCVAMGRYIASFYWIAACMLNITLYMMTILGWE